MALVSPDSFRRAMASAVPDRWSFHITGRALGVSTEELAAGEQGLLEEGRVMEITERITRACFILQNADCLGTC